MRRTNFLILFVLFGLQTSMIDGADIPESTLVIDSSRDSFNQYLVGIRSNIARAEIVLNYLDSLKSWKKTQDSLTVPKISNNIYRVIILGDSVVIPSGTVMTGQIFTLFTKVVVHGEFNGSISVLGNDVEIDHDAVVDADIVILIGKLFDSSMVDYRLGKRVVLDPQFFSPTSADRPHFWDSLIWISVFLLVSLVVFNLRKTNLMRLYENLESHSVRNFLWGVSAYLMFFPIALLCLIMIVGIPFLIPLAIFYAWGSFLGYLAVILWLSHFLIQRFKWHIHPLLLFGLLIVAFEIWESVLYLIYTITPLKAYLHQSSLFWMTRIARLLMLSWGFGTYVSGLSFWRERWLFPIQKKDK